MILARQHGYMMKKVDVKWKFILPNHIYTGNGLKGKVEGKNGIYYPFRGAVCFETCHFQDSPNNPQFPSTALAPGEIFQSHTMYKFVIEK